MSLSVRRVVIALTLGAAVSQPAAAQFQNTGTGSGATDANWSLSWRPVHGGAPASFTGFLANAAIATPTAWWQPNSRPSYAWIGVADNPTLAGWVGDGNRAVRYAFTQSFVATSASVGFMMGWDNNFVGAYLGGSPADEYVDGTRVLDGITGPNRGFGFCRDGDAMLPTSRFPDCTLPFMISGLSVGQVNTVTFVIEGDGLTDGLLVASALDQPSIDGSAESLAISTPVPEPASFVLIATGLLGLAVVARRRA